MKRADIKLGFNCNNRCLFCVQGNKRDKFEDLTTGKAKEVIQKKAENHNQIVFTGGEPTIRDDLIELVSFAKECGFESIQIQSNGRRFAYEDYCVEMIKNGADQFALALQAPDPETHNSMTRTEGSFSQTVKGIKNLKSLSVYVGINTVITSMNYKKLPQLAELLIGLGVDQYQFAFIHISPALRENKELMKKMVPRKSEVAPWVKKGLDKGLRADVSVMTEAIPYCFMEGYEDYIAEEVIPEGSVYESKKEIRDYGEYRRNKGKAKREKCKKCKYFEKCEGPWKEYPEEFGWEEFKPVKD